MKINEQHVKWASEHDWYAGCIRDQTTTIIAIERVVGEEPRVVDFDEFNALLIWAGY